MEQQSINLTKGQRIDLTKDNAALKIAGIGLGWDVNSSGNPKFDLDAFALALQGGKLKDNGHLLFFNSDKSNGSPAILGGALTHSGDNLTGQGDGDDETITIEFAKMPAGVDEVLICVNIYEASIRGNQNFGMVNNAFIRIYDADTKNELAKFDLSEDYSQFNTMVMGRLYLKDGEWKFQATGEGKNGSITDIATLYNSQTA